MSRKHGPKNTAACNLFEGRTLPGFVHVTGP